MLMFFSPSFASSFGFPSASFGIGIPLMFNNALLRVYKGKVTVDRGERL